MKKCPKCEIEKLEDCFATRKSGYRAGQLRPECRDCEKVRMNDYWVRHPEKRREQRKSWRSRDRVLRPDKWKQKAREEKKKAYKNPLNRLVYLARNRVYLAIRGNKKSDKTFELIGCAHADLINHLEKKFKPGMTWENYGPRWHVDHIRPCASFDLSDPAQQRQCFHFTNLQPLWAKDNLVKSYKWG